MRDVLGECVVPSGGWSVELSLQLSEEVGAEAFKRGVLEDGEFDGFAFFVDGGVVLELIGELVELLGDDVGEGVGGIGDGGLEVGGEAFEGFGGDGVAEFFAERAEGEAEDRFGEGEVLVEPGVEGLVVALDEMVEEFEDGLAGLGEVRGESGEGPAGEWGELGALNLLFGEVGEGEFELWGVERAEEIWGELEDFRGVAGGVFLEMSGDFGAELVVRNFFGKEAWVEEIFGDEMAERLGDAGLIIREDAGVGKGDAEWVAKEGGDGEPVGEAADDGCFGKGFEVREPRGVGKPSRGNAEGEGEEEAAGGKPLHAAERVRFFVHIAEGCVRFGHKKTLEEQGFF